MDRTLALAALIAATLWLGPVVAADDEAPKSEKPATAKDDAEEERDLYSLPDDADVPTVMAFVKEIQTFRPTSRQQITDHQKKARIAIQDAARRILAIEKDMESEAWLFAKTTELGGEIRSLIAADEGERKEFVASVEKLLQNKKAGRQQLSLAMQVASMLEDVDPPLAAKAFKKFGAALEGNTDQKLAENARMLSGAARRLDLPGHELKLSGNKFDGSKFELSELKGKVVLVDFWATWCGPCIAEIPNMKKLYEKYHEQGFEIVGLSLDRDRDDLDKFLEARKLPWIILHDQEHEGQHPAATEYGIFGIPTMMLVGKDGKVLDIHARGEKLAELLEQQFADDAAAVPAEAK